jgi:hypothetical protein
MRAASTYEGAYALEARVVGWGPGEARTGRDQASRRGGRARTRRDSIPNAMCTIRQGVVGGTKLGCKDENVVYEYR